MHKAITQFTPRSDGQFEIPPSRDQSRLRVQDKGLVPAIEAPAQDASEPEPTLGRVDAQTDHRAAIAPSHGQNASLADRWGTVGLSTREEC
jgi:hypothetical protein